MRSGILGKAWRRRTKTTKSSEMFNTTKDFGEGFWLRRIDDAVCGARAEGEADLLETEARIGRAGPMKK